MIIALIQTLQKIVAVIRGTPVSPATYLRTIAGQPITLIGTGEVIRKI